MKKFFIALGALLVPAGAYAQNTRQLNNLVDTVISYANKAVGFLMILATIYFVWTVIQLIRADEKTRAEAKQKVTWAVIGLAIMVCVWGLIKFAAQTLGVDTNNQGSNIQIPCPPGQFPTKVPVTGGGTIQVCQ